MLLYIIESAIPLLTILLVWAVVMARRGKFVRHKKMAKLHAFSTFAAYVVVIVLVRIGFGMAAHAPAWIMKTHLAIIYLLPILLVILLVTGFGKKRSTHRKVAYFYIISWSMALLTGGMIFLMSGKHL